MAARVTDSIGGVLILYKGGKVHLEQVHCQDSKFGLEIANAFRQVNYQINQSQISERQKINSSGLSEIIDEKINHEFAPKIQFFGDTNLSQKYRTGSFIMYLVLRKTTPGLLLAGS